MKQLILTVIAALLIGLSSYANEPVKAVKQIYDYAYDMNRGKGAYIAPLPLAFVYHYHGVENQIQFDADGLHGVTSIITPISDAILDRQGFTNFQAVHDGDTIDVSYNLEAHSFILMKDGDWTMYMDFYKYQEHVKESRK